MKILYVINKITKTSIPLEMVNKLKVDFDITVASFYDSNKLEVESLKLRYDNVDFKICAAEDSIIKGSLKLKKIIESGHFDVIHTHHTLSGSLARFFSRKVPNSKVIHTVHAEHDSYSKMQNLIIGSTFNYCDVIVGNSENTLLGLKKWQKNRIKKVKQTVIYNGVDSDLIQNTSELVAEDMLKQYSISDNDLVFGSVGRLVGVKNHMGIIKGFEVFIESIHKSQKAWLLIIGDGPDRLKLENYVCESPIIKNRVLFLGLQDRKIVFSLLKKMNLFIMASFHEGFCNALMEALVSGVPTIVSDINIFKELMSKKDLNTFNPNQSEDIGKCMSSYMRLNKSNEDKNRRMEYYKSKYDIGVCINQYAEVYKNM